MFWNTHQDFVAESKRLQKALILTSRTSASEVVGELLSNVLQYSFSIEKYEIFKLERFYEHQKNWQKVLNGPNARWRLGFTCDLYSRVT